MERFSEAVRGLVRRHPVLWQAVVWSLPAVVFGLALRGMLLWYSPLAYWGSDSRSFMGFADGAIHEWYFSINEKRRYLYPVLMLPLSLLPGGALQWVGWLQAAVGLSAVVAFGYAVRRCFAGWRVWIVPLTLLLAGLPVFLWYEHELIAEGLFFSVGVWALAGWVAWVAQADPARARAHFWWFFVAFAVMVLLKPSTKFFWPGVVVGLAVAWRTLRWPQWAALLALFGVGLTVGDDDQAAWLVGTTAFPAIQVGTPLHAGLKAEIREWVLAMRADLANYADNDKDVHDFLRSPEDHPDRPAWQALSADELALSRAMLDLAREAILAEPWIVLSVGLSRAAGSARLSEFKTERFRATYFADRLRIERNPESMLRLAFGIPRGEPFPPLEELVPRMAPRPGSQVAVLLEGYAAAYGRWGDLFVRTPLGYRPTVLGWWCALGALLCVLPWYRQTLGVWVLVALGYCLAVYLVGVQHTRYFAVVWPVVILLLAVPLDAGWRLVRRARLPC